MAFTIARPAFVVNGPVRNNVVTNTLLAELPPFVVGAHIELQCHTSSPFMQYTLNRRNSDGLIVQQIRMFGALNQFFMDVDRGDVIELRTFANPPEGVLEVQGSIYGWL